MTINKTEEIPEFLIEMSERLNTQDNRLTAHPLFEVRYKQHLITEEGYNESHWEIVDEEEGETLYNSQCSENYKELAEYLYFYKQDWVCDFINYIGVEDDWVFDLSEDKFKEIFNDNYDPVYNDLPEPLKKVHLQEIEVTLNSHFTEADAQAFIDRKQHDYPKLYIYAISLYHCNNMIKLRDWIKGLSKEGE